MIETFINTSVKQHYNDYRNSPLLMGTLMGEFVQTRGKMLEHLWWRKYNKMAPMAPKMGALT